MMRRAYKFLLRPTSKQGDALTAMLNDHRDLYNAALQERRDAWRKRRVSAGFYSQCAQLPAIRAFDSNQARWAASSQQATLRRLDKAFQAFFRRVKAGEAPGYPRFKGGRQFDSVTWPSVTRRNGMTDGCRWNSTPDSGHTRMYLKGVGHVRVHTHRKVEGTIKTLSVKREGRRWYVVLSCDDVPAQPLPETGSAVGIDMGIASFLTTSDGARITNPRHLAASADKLADVQRRLARCKRGSNRRRKTRERIGAISRKVRRQRLDHAHKTALWLVRHHDFIAHEDLRIENMTRRPAPRPDGEGGYLPNGAAGKAGLNRSINDAGWGVLLQCLAEKAEEAARTVIAVNPRHTSQTCHECGHVAASNRVNQAEFRCQACGYEAHADVNAAKNILRAGLALREAS